MLNEPTIRRLNYCKRRIDLTKRCAFPEKRSAAQDVESHSPKSLRVNRQNVLASCARFQRYFVPLMLSTARDAMNCLKPVRVLPAP